VIIASSLGKTYGDFAAVNDLSFTVEDGEIFGLVGPNGADKTTTLKMLAGLIEPTSGHAEVAGLDASDSNSAEQLSAHPTPPWHYSSQPHSFST